MIKIGLVEKFITYKGIAIRRTLDDYNGSMLFSNNVWRKTNVQVPGRGLLVCFGGPGVV